MLSKDDHRRIGRELDLFHFQDESPGAVFWHPRGLAVMRALEEHVRRAVREDGYEEVRSPQMICRAIWERSGHWENFSAGMMRLEGNEAALKPVSCPAHIEIVRRRKKSDAPIRIAELGMVHRNERKSQLLGLFRLRQFVQDDGHVFCAERDVESEVARFVRRVQSLYEAFGFGEDRVDVDLSLRPDVRAGSDEVWDRAESALERAIRACGLAPRLVPGGGAFYGPKLELVLRDRRNRAWQCGTLQLDFVLPERFGIPYVMIHRAMLGSFERFLGILLEQHEGRLPVWLAPEQVRILPVVSDVGDYAEEIAQRLRARDVRLSVDARDQPLGARIKRAHDARVPLLLVVGPRDRDASPRRIAIREGREQRELSFDEAIAYVSEVSSIR